VGKENRKRRAEKIVEGGGGEGGGGEKGGRKTRKERQINKTARLSKGASVYPLYISQIFHQD